MKTNTVIYADLAEELFADRNKAYGGYQIRQKSGQNSMIALGTTTLLAVALLLLLRANSGTVPLPIETGILTLTEVTLPANAYPAPEPEPVRPAARNPHTSPDLKPQPNKPSSMATPVPAHDPAPATDPVGTTTGDSTTTFGKGTGPSSKPECIDCTPVSPTPTTTPEVEPTPFEVFTGDMPVPLNLAEVMGKVGYPMQLREHRVEGKVSYRVLVDEHGNYVRHELIRASHPLFDQQCAQHLSKLRFQPGKMGKQAVKVWVMVPFRFELRK